MSKTIIFAKIRSDGVVVEELSDGSERPFTDASPSTMTRVESHAVDPDAIPMTKAELATARRLPRTKTLRRALGLTQEEFTARYHIPLGTLRDWEQGRCDPDQPARAYLRVIAHDPDGIRKALETPQG